MHHVIGRHVLTNLAGVRKCLQPSFGVVTGQDANHLNTLGTMFNDIACAFSKTLDCIIFIFSLRWL